MHAFRYGVRLNEKGKVGIKLSYASLTAASCCVLGINNIWMHDIGVRKEGKLFKLTISWGDETYGGALSSSSAGLLKYMRWNSFS